MKIRKHCVLFGFCLFVVAPVTYLVTDRDVPFDRKSGEILPANPKREQVVEVIWEAVFHRYCEGTVERFVEDSKGDIWRLPSSATRYQRTSPRQRLSEFVVPKYAACGPATYQVIARYSCNWTQEWWPIQVDKPVIKFNIACDD